MSKKPSKKSVVLVASRSIQRFGEQLVPFLKARGIFPNEGGDLPDWLNHWLESPTGFFWGAFSRQPEVGGTYLVFPKQSKPAEEGGFLTQFRIGDSFAKITTEQPLSGTLWVRVTGSSKGRVSAELVDTPPERESPFKTDFRVFHTADGVTGQLTAFAGTEAMQLVSVLPNELLPMSFLVQLPEVISVRKTTFPLKAVLWGGGQDDEMDVFRLCCKCDKCGGTGEVTCEKCDGAGRLTCKRCGGAGTVPCSKCDETGMVTLPPKDVTCKKCNGSGTITLPPKDVTCKKCEGSGTFRKGNYVGSCNCCGGSGVVHWDAHDVSCRFCNGTGLLHMDQRDAVCSVCKGEGHLSCSGCWGSGHIACFACHGKGDFECWVCKGSGKLHVLVDFKTNRFYRKYKDKITWLAANDVYLTSGNDEHVSLTGYWTVIRQETESQTQEAEKRRNRSDRIVRDGQTVDGCLDRVLRVSPAMVKPFEVGKLFPVPGRKARDRVFYGFIARGDAPWLRQKGKNLLASEEEPADMNESPGPLRPGAHVTFDGVAVPEGKTILYEGCDETGRELIFSFPFEVEQSSLEERRILVKPDAIPPPEKREKERLGIWLENRGAPIFRGLVDGVEEKRINIQTFLNERISDFPVQVDVIQQGLSDSPVLLLKGPPGTGKTTVIVELIRQAVRQGKRVLLTSQTHQAVDNVLERLHRFRESGEDRNVRMAVYSASESKLSELGRRYMAGGQEEECLEIRERAEAVLMRLEAECARNRKLRTLLSEGKESEDPADRGTDIPRLDREFAELDKRRVFALDWATELRASPKAMSRFLNAQTNVFFATCVGMGSWRALSDGTYEMRDETIGGAGRTVFDIAIVDEAGHATFAETIVPMCSAKKVVLIGDDKQLPPMLGEDLDCRRDMDERCRSCAVGADGRQCWYEYSMFQYLWENVKTFKLPRLMLDRQFRMHPDIADFISETFYEGKIRNGVTAQDRSFSFGEFRSAVCLLSTSEQKNRYEKWVGRSCSNPLEAQYVRRILEELLAALDEGLVEGAATGNPLSVAVITPYAAQETLLRRELARCFRKTGRIAFSEEDVASVDRFQGEERDVVIASFVRSPNMKGGNRFPKLTFVHDLKRMNVAFSRARRMLILVGDIKALESARGSELGGAAFARFHEHVDKLGRQILVWERRAR